MVQDWPQELDYIFKYIILQVYNTFRFKKMHMDRYFVGLQVTSITKKLRHTREILRVDFTCVGREASLGVRSDKESKGAN